jgi:hypothetical protein
VTDYCHGRVPSFFIVAVRLFVSSRFVFLSLYGDFYCFGVEAFTATR